MSQTATAPNTVPNTAIVILAAGKGTRMRSAVPKVLHEIAGRPMLGHVLAAALETGASRLCLVTAPDQNDVRDYALAQAPTLSACIQENQLGTGDAVRAAMSALDGVERVVIMFGDTPLMRADILRHWRKISARISGVSPNIITTRSTPSKADMACLLYTSPSPRDS